MAWQHGRSNRHRLAIVHWRDVDEDYAQLIGDARERYVRDGERAVRLLRVLGYCVIADDTWQTVRVVAMARGVHDV
jgi:hypothetical protein